MEEPKPTEQYSTSGIICPYCEYEHDIDSESDYNEDESREYQCVNCDRKFRVLASCNWSWSSHADCEVEAKEHCWLSNIKGDKNIGQISEHFPNQIYCECSECGVRNFIEKSEINN